MQKTTLVQWVQLPVPLPKRQKDKTLYFALAGGLILEATLFFLEEKQPYYFTQEDTHTIFFPAILYAMRGFFESGIFPTWNGYLSLGVPNATLGTYALTYPITYISYALARYGAGNEFLTIEIFDWFHLVVGYFLCFVLLCRLHIRPSLACAGALCFALQGYHLIAVRSWYHNAPGVVFMPALGLSLITFMQKPVLSWRWVIGTALAIGLYFHAGNMQLWFYGVLLWGLAMLWIWACKKQFWAHAYPLALAVAGGLAIAMPLLLLQIIEEKDVPRIQANSSLAYSLSNLLVPWPVISTPEAWGEQINSGTLYFSGGIFIVCFFLRCAFEAAVFGKVGHKQYLATMGFSLVALLAIILAMGPMAHLWVWLLHYPPFSHLRYPIRFLPFATFYMLVNGVLMAETALRKYHYGKIAGGVVAALASGLVVFNASNCRASFSTAPDTPYPPLLYSQKIFQANGWSTVGRLHPIAPFRQYVANTTLSLILSYPALYKIPVIYGHYPWDLDCTLPPNVSANALFKADRKNFYNQFAVTWVTVSKLPTQTSPISEEDLAVLKSMASEVVDLGVSDAYHIETADTKPMAYVESAPHAALLYKIRNDGVEIDTSLLTSDNKKTIIANFLYRPWLQAYTDTGRALPTHADAIGHIAIDLYDRENSVIVLYAPPWEDGLYLGLALIIIVVLTQKLTVKYGKDILLGISKHNPCRRNA